MLTKRTNILFDKDTWGKLQLLAKAKGVSVGELVRKAVQQLYMSEEREMRIGQAMDDILRIRKRFKKIDYKELIEYGRKY